MKLLTDILREVPEFRSLLAAVDGGACPAAVTGLPGVHRAHFAAALRREIAVKRLSRAQKCKLMEGNGLPWDAE